MDDDVAIKACISALNARVADLELKLIELRVEIARLRRDEAKQLLDLVEGIVKRDLSAASGFFEESRIPR